MDWDLLKTFLYIARAGSLAQAAAALQVNHSTISRRLKTLESTLETRLFERGLQGVQLTAPGQRLFEHALRMEAEASVALDELQGAEDQLHGTIRISTEDTFGYLFLPTLIAEFQQQHPLVHIDLSISARYSNLSRREADVIVTARAKPPEHLVGRSLGKVHMLMLAAPSYIVRFGQPSEAKALSQHCVLAPNDSLAHLSMTQWLMKQVPPDAQLLRSDKLYFLFEMVQRGHGIAALPHYLLQAAPELVTLFELPSSCDSEAWILTHPDLRETAAVRTLLSFIADRFQLG